MQQIEEAALTAAHQVFTDPDRRTALTGYCRSAPGDACVQDFLASWGRRVYRRPLEADELARWVGVSTDLAEETWLGLELAAGALLRVAVDALPVERGTRTHRPHAADAHRLRARHPHGAYAGRHPRRRSARSAAAGTLSTAEGRRTEALQCSPTLA